MSSTAVAPTRSRQRIVGLVLTWIAGLFLLLDGAMKLFPPRPVIEATLALGFPQHTIVGMGITLLACTLLYLWPRTALLGAILVTGYLGAAVAAHVRIGNPLFTHLLAPVYVALFVWGGLYLRDARLRAALGAPPARP